MKKKIKNYGKFRRARVWSNNQLKMHAEKFSGAVVNVSGWLDIDKEGGKYKDYFCNAQEYYITNYGGYRGVGEEGEILLNLEEELSSDLIRKFDVVFNHTTLEHIFDVNKAFDNLCSMAEKAVIIVVPFLQEVHVSESYNDYWRFTPYVIDRMFERNGFSLVVCTYNNDFDSAVYLFCIAIRNEHLHEYPDYKKIEIENSMPAGRWLGKDRSVLQYLMEKIKNIK